LNVFINIPIVNEYATLMLRYYETFIENAFSIVKISTYITGNFSRCFIENTLFLFLKRFESPSGII